MSEVSSVGLRAMDSLRTFSPEHRQYVNDVLCEIIRYYGKNLAGLAIFGSFARGENRKDSDLDLLIVLGSAEKRRVRLEEFIREIEMKLDDRAQQLFREQRLLGELSPYILSQSEALMVQPIYYDLVAHHIAVWDPQGIIARIVHSTAALLREVGARRVRRNNTWEWRTNRFLGGISL